MIKKFSKYLHLYFKFLKANLIREAQFRSNLLLVSLGVFLWSAVLIFYYFFIFEHVSSVKGWTLGQALILTGFYLIFDSIIKALIEGNFSQFPRIIYKGELDLILTKPISSQFLISFSRFSLHGFLRFFGGLAVLLWAIFSFNIKISLFGLLVSVLAFILGLIIVYSIWFMILLLTFYLGYIENIYFLFYPLLRISRLPIDVLSKPAQIIFSFVLPLIFISTVPTKALWGSISWELMLYGILAAFFLLWLSNKTWKIALKSYSSASS